MTDGLKPRWRVGHSSGGKSFDLSSSRTLYRNDHFVGVVDSPELAAEIVAAMNGAAPNDREAIAAALSREANRVFQHAAMDYPSNVLDAVAWNLRAGETEFLSMRKHPSGFGMEKPDPKDCPGCAKVRRHPGEGYVCAWHPPVTVPTLAVVICPICNQKG